MHSFSICTVIGTMGTSDSLSAVRIFACAYMLSLYSFLCKVGSLQFRQILSYRVATSTPQGSWILQLGFFIPSAVFAVDVSARLPVVPFGMSITVRQYSLYVTTR